MAVDGMLYGCPTVIYGSCLWPFVNLVKGPGIGQWDCTYTVRSARAEFTGHSCVDVVQIECIGEAWVVWSLANAFECISKSMYDIVHSKYNEATVISHVLASLVSAVHETKTGCRYSQNH